MVRKYELFIKETSCSEYYMPALTNAEAVAKFATEHLHLDMRDREHLITVAVDSKCNVIGYTTTSIGTLEASLVHPREVMKFLILSNAAGGFLIHNHPSGNPEPSDEDIAVTKRMSEAFTLMGISLLDHVIVGKSLYTSMKELGW